MLLKNGHLIDPTTKTNEFMDIRIENGIITKIAKDLTSETGEEILDLSGLTIAPGLIDTHVHFRDPGLTYKEDIHTGSLAAAKGGFTSVICMANTKPTVDSVDTLNDILNRAKVENIHIYQTASVSYGLNGEKMTDFDALADAGAVDLLMMEFRSLTPPSAMKPCKKQLHFICRSASMKKTKHLLPITVLTPVKLLPNSVLSVHLPLQKK